MALTTKRIRELWENYSPTQGIESFARAIEAEVRKQDDALIQQLLEELEKVNQAMPFPVATRAIAAGRARLGENPSQ